MIKIKIGNEKYPNWNVILRKFSKLVIGNEISNRHGPFWATVIITQIAHLAMLLIILIRHPDAPKEVTAFVILILATGNTQKL